MSVLCVREGKETLKARISGFWRCEKARNPSTSTVVEVVFMWWEAWTEERERERVWFNSIGLLDLEGLEKQAVGNGYSNEDGTWICNVVGEEARRHC